MKNNIDLTEFKDFSPDKFKIKKVQSEYYDGNGGKSRLPWNKSGELYKNHRITYFSYDYNFTFTTGSTNRWIITNTDGDMIWDDLQYNTWESFNMQYSPTTTAYGTSNIYDTTWSFNQVYVDKVDNSNYKSFKLGKVKDIRQKRTFDYNCNTASIPALYKINHKLRCLTSDTMRDLKKEYEPNYIPKNMIRESWNDKKSMNWHVSRSHYLLDDVTYFRDTMDWIYESEDVSGYKTNDYIDTIFHDILKPEPRTVKCIYRKIQHNPRRAFDNNIGVKWPDFHDDYLREMEGFNPRNDWRRGVPFDDGPTLRRLSGNDEDILIV